MFDNLKKKLGSFRSDAEETAEEKAEPVDEDDLEDEELEAESADQAETTVDDPDEPAGTDAVSESASESESEVESEDSDSEATADAEPATPTPKTVGETDGTDDSGAESAVGVGGDESEPETAGEPDSEPDSESESESESESASASDSEDTDGNGTGFGRKAKSLVRGKFVIEEDDLEGPLDELELALLSSDVELGVAEEIIDSIRDNLVGETRTFTTSTGDVVEEALRDAILDVISVGQFDFDERVRTADKPLVIIFTGVNGVGKTTTIAKLSQYLEQRGYSNVMANGDTYRAGANEQIREHADALDTKLIAHDQGGDPAAVLYDAVEYAEANDVDVVLGDTAGRLHTNEDLMAQLEKIGRVVDPDMTLFVDEAVAGQDAIKRAQTFNEAAEIDGAILTKADADSNGGAAISIAHVTGKPILFLGVGQGYDDIEQFDPEEMADRLLEDA